MLHSFEQMEGFWWNNILYSQRLRPRWPLRPSRSGSTLHLVVSGIGQKQHLRNQFKKTSGETLTPREQLMVKDLVRRRPALGSPTADSLATADLGICFALAAALSALSHAQLVCLWQLLLRHRPPAHTPPPAMNAFSVLQDDVEDAADMTAAPRLGMSVVEEPEEAPAAVAPAGHAPKKVGAPAPRRERPGKGEKKADNKPAPKKEDEEVPGAAEEPEATEETKPKAPVEKEMTYEEYLEKKAQMAAAFAGGLGAAKTARKANEGASGFDKLSVVKKADHAEEAELADESSLLSSVTFKEQRATKERRDSTHAAVLDNAKIQSFFNKTPTGPRPSTSAAPAAHAPRANGSSDARNFSNSNGGGAAPQRDFRDKRQFSNGPGRGGANAGRGRGGPAGPRYNNAPRGSSHPNVSSAPNMNDTAAFPSLA
jgi:hypothetical protein